MSSADKSTSEYVTKGTACVCYTLAGSNIIDSPPTEKIRRETEKKKKKTSDERQKVGTMRANLAVPSSPRTGNPVLVGTVAFRPTSV